MYSTHIYLHSEHKLQKQLPPTNANANTGKTAQVCTFYFLSLHVTGDSTGLENRKEQKKVNSDSETTLYANKTQKYSERIH